MEIYLTCINIDNCDAIPIGQVFFLFLIMISAMAVETADGRLVKLSPVSLSASHFVFFIPFPPKLFSHPVLVTFQYEFVQWPVNVLSKPTASGCV